MKFVPCQDKCTYDGTHCQGCGRSHIEIAETKQLVTSIVDFAQKIEYENSEDFTRYIAQKALRKLQSAQ